MIKERIRLRDLRDWRAGVKKNKKLDVYKKVKHRLECEPYLLDTRNRSGRIEMTKLRISAHQLRVETGRYVKDRIDDRKERICLFCADGMEDEHHYLSKCARWKSERDELKRNVENVRKVQT